jgi:uncharacterized protein YdeI (YjbR/CyaY-like superfamily)
MDFSDDLEERFGNEFAMSTSRKNPQVDVYLRKAKKWREEMELLRTIALSCPLMEELKWGKPCYTFQDKNVVLIIGFKNYCSLLLCKGALLKDAKGILIKPGEHTQAARQIRFTDVRTVVEMKSVLKAYLEEAVAVEKAGLEVIYKKPTEFVIPEEFQKKLDESSALKTAFAGLTPGRQKAYLLYFSGAKQSQTRASRVEKYRKQILKGKGLLD